MRKLKRHEKYKIRTFISTIQIVLLFVFLGLIFAPAIVSINDAKDTFSGVDVVFGKVITTNIFIGELHSTIYEFSILNLIPYVFALVSIVVILVGIISRNRYYKVYDFVVFLLLIISGAFLLNVVSFTIPGAEISEIIGLFGGELNLENYYELGIGSLISAILLFLSSLLASIKLIIEK